MPNDFESMLSGSPDDFSHGPMRGDLSKLRRETAETVMQTYTNPAYNSISTMQIEAQLAPQLGWVERTASHPHSRVALSATNSLSMAIQQLGGNQQVLDEAETLATQAQQKELENLPPSTRPRPSVLKV